MAGAPEVKVRISGDQKGLDDSLSKAEGSLASFAGKWPVVGAAVAAVGAAIGVFAKGAVDEAAKAELGMVRLSQSVTNAGGSFRTMAPEIERTVQKVMALSTATDDDLRDALTRMIGISGDVSGSMKNLQLVTDVAAFKQMDLGAAADLVGKAMTGQTKVLGQFGDEVKKAKDPIEALRATVGGYAEKEAKTFSGSLERINNQWGEFQEAVGNAILSGGEMTGMADGLAGVLGGLAGWVERNEDAFIMTRDAVLAVVGAMFDVGKAVYQVVQPALGPVFKVLLGGLIVGLQTAALGVRTLGAFFKGLAGDTLQSLGTIVEKGGKLLKVFGIDVVSETGASIKEFGRNLKLSASDDVASAAATYKKGMLTLFGQRQDATREMETLEAGHQTRVTRIHEEGHEKRLTKAQEKAELMKLYMSRANEIFEATSKALEQSTRPVLRDMKADWSEIDEKVKKASASIYIAKDAQEELAEAGEGVRKKQQEIADEVAETREKFEDNVDSAQSLGTSLVGVAAQMGVIDQKAAGALTSVINMGASIAKFGLGSPEGILSVINGLANLIGGWGSSPAEQARKDAMMKNTRAIEELSRDLSEYNLGVSGEQFASVTETLGNVFDPPDWLKNMPGYTPEDPSKALQKAGLMPAAKKLAERYGIDLSEGPGAWAKLFSILKGRRFGGAEGNFEDELSAMESSFGVLGIEDADDRIKMFGEFAAKHIPALAIPLSTANLSSEGGRAALVGTLKGLYRDSLAGKLAPAQYGKSTAAQFRQIIATLLQLVGGADGFLSSAQSIGPSVPNVPVGGESVPGASSGTSGLVSGGSIGVGAGVAGAGGMAPTLEIGGGMVHNGDNVININLPDIRDSQEAAEIIADKVKVILGQQYRSQLTALGVV